MKTNILYLFIISSLLISCGKSTEVTVADDSTGILPGEIAQNQSTETAASDGFTILKVGETNPIHTADPLYATTSSESRLHSLIYDGLTRIDESGSVASAIAKNWTISRDSLRYTFTIRDDVFYHDSYRFASGVGRQVSPEDIISNFERMASLFVPDNAADLFSSIQGFKAFHAEQTYIKIPGNRVIKSIEGITTPNDSTLVFVLAKKDSKFLKNLAHPLASVYPKESLSPDKSPIYEAIGTGEYYLAQRKTNDLILASNSNYYRELELPTRIDIKHGKKEGDIYQDFAKGELDALIEIGPGTIQQVTDDEGNIDPVLSSVFKVERLQVDNPINFYYNPDSENRTVYEYLTSRNNSYLTFENALGKIEVINGQTSTDNPSNMTTHIAYTENPSDIYFINAIAQKLSGEGVNSVLNSSYAVTDEVTFSTTYFPSALQTVVWNYPMYVLSKPGISGIKIYAEPWNISFADVNIAPNN